MRLDEMPDECRLCNHLKKLAIASVGDYPEYICEKNICEKEVKEIKLQD